MLQRCVKTVYLRRHVFGRLYSDGRVPLSRGQHRHLVQELVDARHQVVAVFGFVRDVVENLSATDKRKQDSCTVRVGHHLVVKVHKTFNVGCEWCEGRVRVGDRNGDTKWLQFRLRCSFTSVSFVSSCSRACQWTTGGLQAQTLIPCPPSSLLVCLNPKSDSDCQADWTVH